MIKRNENEERVYKLLLDCGVPEDQIDEPDKQAGQQDKNPDFLVKQVDVVVEVKHFEDDELKKEDLPKSVREALNSDIPIVKAIALIVEGLEKSPTATDNELRNSVLQFLNTAI